MNNKKTWVLYGVGEGKVELYTDLKVAEKIIAEKHGITNKVQKGPGVWQFGPSLILKRQELFGSNGLG